MKSPKRRATAKERFWEILPASVTWTSFVLLVVLSWKAPFFISYVIMLYSLLWFVKSMHVSVHLVHTYRQLRMSRLEDWQQRLADLENPSLAQQRIRGELATLRAKLSAGTFRSRRLLTRAIQTLERRNRALSDLVARMDSLPDWREVWHLVVIPTYNEPTVVLEQSIAALERARFPKSRLLVLVGIEERAKEAGQAKAKALQDRFAGVFGGFWTVTHPDGIAGEHKGKSANATYAVKHIVPVLRKKGVPLSQVVVSNFDADTQAHADYFSVLTEAFVINPRRLRASYQPVPVYHNNLWQVPMLPRVSAIGSSFWQMIEASRVHRLVSFSSHAIPLQAVLDVGGWDVTRISEDSRIFWQCYMRYQGDYYVVPLPITVSMDAVQADSWWKTLVSLYRQKRRWAWGAENLAYLGTNFFGKNHVRAPLSARILHVSRMVEGFYSWATSAIVLAVGGWLPSTLGGPEFRDTVLGQNFLTVTRAVLTVALLGVAVSIWISMRMLPPAPQNVTVRRRLSLIVQWLFTPLVTIFFGSIPAIDAHARLALGRYMEFQVMPKTRVTKTEVVSANSNVSA
jgi:cellulose synthase/poly-beta-1,6-N-acetylglucosamine synthase-like glycosyltransferase